MSWTEKLKLNKQLVRSVTEAGFITPREIQQKTLSRIIGGQDVIAIGPEGCGKTMAYILGVLNRFNYQPEGVPQVLILVPSAEHVEQVIGQFNLLNKNKSIAIVALHTAGNVETQMDTLAEGADIVVATPDRARAIYLKLGLNLNKVQLLVIDNAELMVKQGLQLPVNELAASITKCQHLVFAEVMHDRLHKMIDQFMKQPALIEVEEIGEAQFNLYPQGLYLLPDFGTKLNLLKLFIQDAELFTKLTVFVNTRPTAEKLYQELQDKQEDTVALLSPWSPGARGFADIETFKQSELRVLIITGDYQNAVELTDIPFLIHFELPDNPETFIARISKAASLNDETMALTFATDLELGSVRKIEQATGQKMPLMELPEELIFAKAKKKEKPKDEQEEQPSGGAAFHEKKASNAKTHNYGAGVKAKMTKKKKYG